jgi:predicted cytidylate kinase
MIVTVGGLPGTGTSTLCRLLERELGLPYVYAGQIFRQEAAARGLSLQELNELAGEDDSVDHALDDRQIELLRKGNVILEGRVSGWLASSNEIPAFKVWLEADEDERIRRLVDRDGGDFSEQRRMTRERVAQEADRYRRYYGAEVADPAIYDLVLDSTGVEPPELVRRVVTALDSWR